MIQLFISLVVFPVAFYYLFKYIRNSGEWPFIKDLLLIFIPLIGLAVLYDY